MKNNIKIIISICLLTAFIYGCSGNRYIVAPDNTLTVSSESSTSIETGKTETVDDPSAVEDNLPYDTLILTVNSSPVYWPEFHFWLNYIEKYYKNYRPEAIAGWDTEKAGMSLNDFYFSCAVGYACKDRAIEAKTKELGIELSVKDQAEIEKKRKENIQIYGSELEYLRIVASMYITEDVFNYLSKIDYLGNYMFKHFYGANGEKCTDEEVSSFVEKQGLKCAKYIFISNTGSDGKPLSPEQQKENYDLLEGALTQLRASADPMTLFNETMNKYGKEMNTSNYPNGQLFTEGGMGEEFESAFEKLKENEFSGVVKTGQGCYIIMRMPIFPDMAVDSSGSTLRYMTAYDYLFKKQVEDLSSKMEVKYEDAYYKLLKKN